MLAHRNERFTSHVARVLHEAGIVVVDRVDNGADAVGLLIAEQPDLLLTEDLLAMGGADDVLRQAREFAPHTLIGVQAAYNARTGPLLRGGAAAVFSRHSAPQDVAGDLLQLLTT